MFRKSFLVSLMAGAAALSAATVIDFEDLSVSNGGAADVPNGYTSQGYVFTSTTSNTSQAFAVWATNNTGGYFPGSTALFNNFANEKTTMLRVDQGAFSMASIDLCNVYRNGTVQDILFTGTRADTSTVANTFSLTDPANMHTFTFSGMTNIVKLEWFQYSPYHQFDNVSIVPEPASLAVLGLGAAALLRRRRK